MKKIRPTCDQCLYHEHCYDLLDASDCAAYKDKDKFVELPCQIGDYVSKDLELFRVVTIIMLGDHRCYAKGVSVLDGICPLVVDDTYPILTSEEAQQWLNEHGYDDILIGEMHE